MQQEEWQIVEPPQSPFTKKLALNFDRFNIVPNYDIVIDQDANSHPDNETDTIYVDYEQNNEPTIYQSVYKSSDSIIPPSFPLFIMDQPPTSTRESSADMKAKWESNPVQGPSMPYFGSPKPTDNTGQTMEQFEKSTLSNQFRLGFPSHQQPSFFPENKARDIKPCNPRRTQAREKKKEEEKNEEKNEEKKPMLTEHKLPPVDVQQQTEEEERPRRIQRGTLARCFQTQEESLAGIYLEIEKECLITECYKLKSLNLSRQGITALNDLNLYFPVLERLKLSHNELTQLSGLPESLCYLYANDNKLTSIDLAHLGKLQHLYLSHNHLSGFDNLSELKLLRKLDIGNNFIKSIRPFKVLEGLTHLYLKSNNIHRLKEFEDFNNPDLEYLDLSFNRIEHLESMESLTGLIELNIDHNDLKVIQLTRPLERLCKLRLSFNRLKSFDMSLFPDIRVLYLDDNQIERIMGAACTKRMESFSLRDQGKIKVEINIKYLRGARKLYLSGSPFQSLKHMVDFYSLKYLELCTADIEELPSQFSKQMPNLATLYLSTNRIADIRPLRKLKYLQRLILIDNRITSLNEVIAVVKQLKNLVYLDLRQNPISTNLYNPLSLSLLKGDHRPPLDDSDNKSQTSNSPYVSTALDSEWQAQDGLFLQSLNDHWKMRRKVYRSLLLLESPKLIELDHIQIHDLERSQAPNIIHEYSSNQNSNPASSSHGYSD